MNQQVPRFSFILHSSISSIYHLFDNLVTNLYDYKYTLETAHIPIYYKIEEIKTFKYNNKLYIFKTYLIIFLKVIFKQIIYRFNTYK